MTTSQWIFGVGGGLLMLAFLIFSFRQGSKVRGRPEGKGDRSRYSSSEGGVESGGD
jgi:hypothetical protein